MSKGGRVYMSELISEKGIKEIECQFCPNPYFPGEGYYRIQTADGEFLGNIGVEELDYEISLLRQNGCRLVQIVRKEPYDHGRGIL